MEYDRAGYRYDGDAAGSGLGVTGFNPGVTNTGGILTTSAVKGDYYIFDPSTKSIADPSTVINQGASTPQATTSPTTTVKYKTWAQGGVAEVDCLMCHLSNSGDLRYANLERAYAFPGANAPKLAASLGLAGAKGGTGLLTIARKGDHAGNPNIATTGWSWTTTSLTADRIAKTPSRENCTICHFPDQSWWANCGASNWPNYNPESANCGPAGKPFGATMFQKLLPIGAVVDGDIIALNSTNTGTWKIAKGRVEAGKRGESINGAGNPDAHMKTAGSGMGCVDCHYALEGTVDALTDASGNIIQPAVTVQKIDHQFAKGNNAPDGKNMDQLDNTVTCASCHVDGTHPGAAGAPSPATAHAGFPAAHFEKIDCKTCHIPVVNGPVKQLVSDFTAGPFQTFERTQVLEAPPGINMKPLYMWRATEHDGSGLQIEPIMTMAVRVWANRVEDQTTGAVSYNPTYQRAAKMAAEKYRSLSGDDGAGKYSFKLNAPVSYAGAVSRTAYSSVTATNVTYAAKGAAFVINTEAEVQGVADIFKNPGTYGMPAQFGAVSEPVIHFYFNQFALSHNVASKTTGTILGSAKGGGCVMCHSSSDPQSEYYSDKSVGFFDKTFTLFDLPTDGLPQTSVDNVQKINIKFGYKKSDGSSGTVNLGDVADGTNIGNTLDQGAILGYSEAYRQELMSIGTGTTTAGDPVNGSCGGSNGQTLAVAPTTNLCAAGAAGSVNGSGPWTWTCEGTNGGSTANCSANLQAPSPTPPDGDLDGGGVSITDALRALRISAGLITPAADDLAKGDVAPLVNGKPQPDGIIDIGEVVVILRRAVGVVSW